MCSEHATVKRSHVKLQRFIGYRNCIKICGAIFIFLLLPDGIKSFQGGKLCIEMFCQLVYNVSGRESDSSVIIVSRLPAGRPKNRGSIPGMVEIILLCTVPKLTLWPTKPPIDTGTHSIAIDQQRREADYSPTPTTEIENA
jgi:hypothetical protein